MGVFRRGLLDFFSNPRLPHAPGIPCAGTFGSRTCHKTLKTKEIGPVSVWMLTGPMF